ncbi:cytosine/adenosine deaminase-related metal-dependent hydrolase [Roseiarcus fermentans]|uniref:Cytosine/adenosine deaminase-related metal-dependent hydrolase n=1 Tax=Roseiarcus fermentans TaxID=1473586 RepID=A0A366EKE4_9HYPH|nr:amidohydrolase family protein [Roseiarcus fermentans]RBP02887.1 cytosine/adenosine deaminase-related metal-dependent hydrolase [Roseiarcus fermentans]
MAVTAALVVGPDRNGRSVAIDGGRVVAEAPKGAARLACGDGEIVPGAVCAHTHLYSGLVRYGLPPPDPPPRSFPEILQSVWWRLDRALDEASLAAAARDHAARALLAGVTTLVDHHESPNLIEDSLPLVVEACAGLGVRALVAYGATERNFGRNEARRGLEACRRVAPSPLVRGLVGLHASFTVSDETIRDAGALARELGTVVHVHVAEDRADVDDARRRGWAGPLERLTALDALPRGSILAHGVHCSAEAVRRAGDAGAWFVHNPRSNESNRVGYAATLSATGRVALGTDGFDPDMGAEEAALRRLAAENGDTRIDGRLAAGHGLVAERFDAAAEPLAPGSLGDCVVRRDDAVVHVVVDGRVVVEGGRLVTGDAERIFALAREQAAGLWARMAELH